MPSTAKLVKMSLAIEPELKAFLDEVLIPMLVRDALKDLAAESALASGKPSVAHSSSTVLHSAQEMA